MNLRLQKVLAKRTIFDGHIMSWGEFLKTHTITNKTSEIRRYSSKRIKLEYKKLKTPVVKYTLWFGTYGYDVPKIIWDAVKQPTVQDAMDALEQPSHYEPKPEDFEPSWRAKLALGED